MQHKEKPAKKILQRLLELKPKTRRIAVTASFILALILTATTCGTFAWFTYASNVYINEYKGVSIGSLSLELGYVSAYEFDEASIYGVTEVERTEDDKYIYWFRNGVSNELIHKLIALNGYAYDNLYPVTTGSYSATNDNFSLLRAPLPRKNYTREDKANQADYTFMSLAFRVSDALKPNVYLADNDIYLSIADIESDFEIKEAFRAHTDNLVDEEDGVKMKHLINLDKSIYADGYDEVGGVLDLNGDGFYDFHDDPNDSTKEVEAYYGEFENVGEEGIEDVQYVASPRVSDSEQEGKHTTFNAKHRAGVYEVNSNITQPKRAEFEYLDKFQQDIEPVSRTREYSVLKIINNEYTLVKENIAFLDMAIFVEGWDLKAIDPDVAGQVRSYEMSIQFEVNY